MSTNIATAAHEYARRPKDENFETSAGMLAAAVEDKARSKERTYNLKDLRIVPVDTAALASAPRIDTSNPIAKLAEYRYQDARLQTVEAQAADTARTLTTLMLESPKGRALFTHWSFAQACSTLGLPAAAMRDKLSPELAAACLNYRIAQSVPGSEAQLLVRLPNGQPLPVVRAMTGEGYGRVWDADYLHPIQQHFGDGADGGWISPTSWGGDTYAGSRGDRDSFCLRVNGGSIVTDPSAQGQNGQMYRGLLVRNSEVGATSISIQCILFRWICGNFMLWGALVDRQYSRRHVGKNALRDTLNELYAIAHRWADRPASADEKIIRALIDTEIASTQAAVIDQLRSYGASKDQAEAAYAACIEHENASPRSYWGIAQGLTRNSQASGYQDERNELDKLAALVMKRGARLVAA